jgi:hypothetical protein
MVQGYAADHARAAPGLATRHVALYDAKCDAECCRRVAMSSVIGIIRSPRACIQRRAVWIWAEVSVVEGISLNYRSPGRNIGRSVDAAEPCHIP